jgi:hypothetical protein
MLERVEAFQICVQFFAGLSGMRVESGEYFILKKTSGLWECLLGWMVPWKYLLLKPDKIGRSSLL